MQRTLTNQTPSLIGTKVTLKGWVDTIRDHGKITFLDLRDRSGIIQVVGQDLPKLNPEDTVEILGQVKKRPEKLVNPNLETGSVELEVESVKILSHAAELPISVNKQDLDLDITTLLDHRALTLRHPKVQAIFKVQAVVIDSFREFMKSEDFFEFQAPSISPAAAEGGADVFEIKYFKKKAYLTQSPQLYKQIVMTAFERVFSVNKIFRAEPSMTTRHLTEIVSLDAEMGFIDSWKDVKNMADSTIKYMLNQVKEKCSQELALFNVTIPNTITDTPTISLKQAQEKIYKNSSRDVRQEKDLSPEDEAEICKIIKQETGSDLVFIYGYPTKDKPFYVYPDPKNPKVNQGIDLLCNGVEWLSGGRRINDYKQLTDHVKKWKIDKNKISMFLEAFKYGAPPEGGFAFGAERITMQILKLNNIRQACMFPRDMKRIDKRLSKS
jgi:nondiscriminating aspartyl-tRNA synthetase